MVRRRVIRANRRRDRTGLADPDAQGVIQGTRDGRHRKPAGLRNGLQGRAVAVFGKIGRQYPTGTPRTLRPTMTAAGKILLYAHPESI